MIIPLFSFSPIIANVKQRNPPMDTRKLKQAYAHLVAGKYYKVAKTFVDYDRITRFEGEVWKFVGSSFWRMKVAVAVFQNQRKGRAGEITGYPGRTRSYH
jgi:hypothetical protein